MVLLVSGTVTVTATANDNVGVTSLQIYIDGALKARATTSPLNYSWNTSSLPNGSHTIYSKAYDAAGNVGTSTTITVKVSGASTQLVFNGGFELGSLAYWSVSGVDFPAVVTTQAHTGAYSVRLGVSSGHGAQRQLVAVRSRYHTLHGDHRNADLLVLGCECGQHCVRLAGGPGTERIWRNAGANHEDLFQQPDLDPGDLQLAPL